MITETACKRVTARLGLPLQAPEPLAARGGVGRIGLGSAKKMPLMMMMMMVSRGRICVSLFGG